MVVWTDADADGESDRYPLNEALLNETRAECTDCTLCQQMLMRGFRLIELTDYGVKTLT
jgi:hypothetical protein